MPIKNYTTEVAVGKTMGEITQTLSRRGVNRISTLFDDNGNPTGIGFTMKTDYGFRDFEFTVNSAGVLAVLKREAQPRYQNPDQAARVGWRIAKDWLEAQVALVEIGLASMDQVFMPYMIGDAKGHTVYDLVRAQGLKELEAAK